MPPLESSIDSLYQGSPDNFVAARNALAKSLSGDDARRVKQLSKPTTVAWAVNQLYWQRRPTYDSLIKSGKSLRTAQIGALNGRSVDVRRAVEAHREIVSQAVAETSQLASEAGIHPGADELSRTFEALSLGTAGPEHAGRLSTAMQPAGFEALAGIVVKAPVEAHASRPAAPPRTGGAGDRPSRRDLADQRARERKEAAADRQKRAAIARAQEEVVRAQAAEDRARSEWERCKRVREETELALGRLQNQ